MSGDCSVIYAGPGARPFINTITSYVLPRGQVQVICERRRAPKHITHVVRSLRGLAVVQIVRISLPPPYESPPLARTAPVHNARLRRGCFGLKARRRMRPNHPVYDGVRHVVFGSERTEECVMVLQRCLLLFFLFFFLANNFSYQITNRPIFRYQCSTDGTLRGGTKSTCCFSYCF